MKRGRSFVCTFLVVNGTAQIYASRGIESDKHEVLTQLSVLDLQHNQLKLSLFDVNLSARKLKKVKSLTLNRSFVRTWYAQKSPKGSRVFMMLDNGIKPKEGFRREGFLFDYQKNELISSPPLNKFAYRAMWKDEDTIWVFDVPEDDNVESDREYYEGHPSAVKISAENTWVPVAIGKQFLTYRPSITSIKAAAVLAKRRMKMPAGSGRRGDAIPPGWIDEEGYAVSSPNADLIVAFGDKGDRESNKNQFYLFKKADGYVPLRLRTRGKTYRSVHISTNLVLLGTKDITDKNLIEVFDANGRKIGEVEGDVGL